MMGSTGSVTESYSKSRCQVPGVRFQEKIAAVDQFTTTVSIHYSRRPIFVSGHRQGLRKPIANFGECGKLFCQVRAQPLTAKTPAPVALFAAGNIHTRVTAQRQRILQGDHAKAGDGPGRGANHRPVDAFLASFTSAEVGLRLLALVFGGSRFPPAEQSVVIMRAGIDHFLAGESVGQMDVSAGVAE